MPTLRALVRPSTLAAPTWTRRAWLGAAALGLTQLSVVAQAGSNRRVLILGDSMIAGALGLFLERALRERHGHGVHRHGKSSTGLARPDFYNWQDAGPSQAKAHPADAVVVMFGGNDAQALRTGTTQKDGWIRWAQAPWEDEYRQRIRSFSQNVAPAPTQLYWIGMPVMRPDKLNARVRYLNRIYRSEMALREQAAFIDIWDLLADEDGAYSDRIAIAGKKTTVRAGDGVHLTVAGAHFLADAIAPMIDRGLIDGV